MIQEYIAHRVQRGDYSTASAEHVARVLDLWHRWAGPPPWTTEQVSTWVHDPTLRPATRKMRLSRLRPYCRWATRHGRLPVDPTLDVAPVRLPKPAPRDLDVDQVRQLVTACPDNRARLIVILMVQCGLRAGDLARVRIEDLDHQRRTLHVRGKGGRGDHTHWVHVPAEAWDLAVATIVGSGRRAGPLITSSHDPTQGLSSGHVSVLVRRWLRSAGLKAFPYDGVSPHSLRHSCAQHLLDGGADIREVQHHLGHAHVTTTEGYLRRDPPGLRDVVDGRRYTDAA